MLNSLRKLLAIASLVAVLYAPAVSQTPPGDASDMLPHTLGSFSAQSAVEPVSPAVFRELTPEDLGILSGARRAYASYGSETVTVHLALTRSNLSAYGLQKEMERQARSQSAPEQVTPLDIPQVVGFSSPGHVVFIKGEVFVAVAGDSSAALDLARWLAEQIAGTAVVPPLVQHLPEWERAQERAAYAVSQRMLQEVAGPRPAFDAVSFEGGTEAVTATYGASRLVVIEFTTPQYAGDNDARINERIRQLREAGEPTPSAYQRVGNYSVFVFDAPDEGAAAELVANVKYEKEVRWLGDNPHAYQRATQQYTNTMGNVILTTLKTTGLAILLCLGVGGLFGAAVFMHRRARATTSEAYSDAGGMLRLNLEDAHGTPDASQFVAKRKS